MGLIATRNDKHSANGITLRIQRNVGDRCLSERFLLFSIIFEIIVFSVFFRVFIFGFDVLGKMNQYMPYVLLICKTYSRYYKGI